MNGRLKGLGIVLVAIGFAFIAGGGYAFMKVQDGAKSLATFSAARARYAVPHRTMAHLPTAARPPERRRS